MADLGANLTMFATAIGESESVAGDILRGRPPPRGYDEPESLSYAITSICPVSVDGEQFRRSFSVNAPRGGTKW